MHMPCDSFKMSSSISLNSEFQTHCSDSKKAPSEAEIYAMIRNTNNKFYKAPLEKNVTLKMFVAYITRSKSVMHHNFWTLLAWVSMCSYTILGVSLSVNR